MKQQHLKAENGSDLRDRHLPRLDGRQPDLPHPRPAGPNPDEVGRGPIAELLGRTSSAETLYLSTRRIRVKTDRTSTFFPLESHEHEKAD